MTLPWRVFRWIGTSWVAADVKRWIGSQWATANAYSWNGSAWTLATDRTPGTTTHNDQFNNASSATYRGNNSLRTDTFRYQGYYDGLFGIQKSMYTFDYSTISSALTGRTATYSCGIILDNEHTYFAAGGIAVVGTSTATSPPSTFNYNRYGGVGSFHYDRGEAAARNVTTDMAQWFAEQSARAITLYADSTDATYYGYYTTSAALLFSYEK